MSDHDDNVNSRIRSLEESYKIPEEWKNGPVQNKKRGCTDICCCIVFLMLVLTMLATGFWLYSKTSVDDLTKIYDSEGNVCGQGNTKDYPFLYFQNFEEPYKTVCVKECPEFDYNAIKYNVPWGSEDGTAVNAEYPGPLHYQDFSKKYGGLSKTSNPKFDEKEAFAFNKEWANDYFTEEQWNKYLDTVKIDCHTNADVPNCSGAGFYKHDSATVFNFCSPQNPKASLLFNKVTFQFDQGLIFDLEDGLPLLLYSVLIALACSLVLMILLVCMPGLIIWLMFLALVGVLIAFGVVMLMNEYYPGSLNDGVNAARVKYLSFLKMNKILITVVSILCLIAAVVLVIVLLKYLKKINLVIDVIKEAVKVTLKNIMLVFLSLFIIILQVCVLVYEIHLIGRIRVLGDEIKDNVKGSPFPSYGTTADHQWLMALHIFGTYWVLIFLNNFNDYVTTAITLNHFFAKYEARKITNMRIFCHVLVHNVGTIAWSIILLPALILKLVFGSFDVSNKKGGFAKFINMVCCPCCWCYENFVDRFSESYFTTSYLGSEGFWTATSRVYYLTERYGDTTLANRLGDLVQVVSKLLVGFITLFFGKMIYDRNLQYQQNIDYPGTMFFIVFVLGFLVGSLFVNLFSTAYATLLTCYLVEKDLQTQYGVSMEYNDNNVTNVIRKLQDGDSDYKPLNDN